MERYFTLKISLLIFRRPKNSVLKVSCLLGSSSPLCLRNGCLIKKIRVKEITTPREFVFRRAKKIEQLKLSVHSFLARKRVKRYVSMKSLKNDYHETQEIN